MANSSPQSSTGETPPIDYTFYFEMKPFRYLRVAVEALCDPDFNDHGLGRIDVDDNGLEITVENESKATASLYLASSGMISFCCTKSMIGKFVNLGLIFRSCPTDLDGDDDIVRVYHVDGFDKLWFDFETVPQTGFSAKFITTESQIERYSPATLFYESLISAKDLRDMIKYSLRTGDESVTLAVVKHMATVRIGITKRWNCDYKNLGITGTTAVKEGETKLAFFNWTYPRFLEKASFLEPGVAVGILLISKDHIMFRFRMRQLGRLLIRKKAEP